MNKHKNYQDKMVKFNNKKNLKKIKKKILNKSKKFEIKINL